MKKIVIIFLFFLSLTIITSGSSGYPLNTAQDKYVFKSENDRQLFETLIKELRCVVCQNQNLAESNAPLAEDLRQKIYTMINDKKEKEFILNRLVRRFGDFVTYEPNINKRTLMLWGFPVLAFFIALFIWFYKQ